MVLAKKEEEDYIIKGEGAIPIEQVFQAWWHWYFSFKARNDLGAWFMSDFLREEETPTIKRRIMLEHYFYLADL